MNILIYILTADRLEFLPLIERSIYC
uniref:Uncharacterized protein n=1 Tax=Arundo donax TaxID=35708 RepID=A0A0A9C9I2_ARUDO